MMIATYARRRTIIYSLRMVVTYAMNQILFKQIFLLLMHIHQIYSSVFIESIIISFYEFTGYFAIA